MIVLDLTPGCLEANNRADIHYLEALMLWPPDRPENGAARRRWMNAAMVRHHADHLHELSEGDVREVLQIAADTIPIGELRSIATERMQQGVVAGAILRESIQAAAFANGTVNKGKVQTSFVERTRALRRKFEVRLENKTIDNALWPQYRSVAHLWAAYSVLVETGRNAFPCALRDLAEFLAWAKEFQIQGEAATTKQGPLLRPGETVGIPDHIVLPSVEIKFQSPE